MLAALLGLAFQAPSISPALPQLETWIECADELVDLSIDARGRVLVLLTASELSCWELDMKEPRWKVPQQGQSWVEDCGKVVLTAMRLPSVDQHDPESGTRTSGVALPTGDVPSCFAADPSGKWAWFGGEKGLVRLTPGDVNGWSRRSLEGCPVTALAIDAEGELLAAGCQDGSVRFADAQSASVEEKKLIEGAGPAITALVFGPKVLVAAASDGSLRTWSVASCKQKLVLQESGAPVTRLAVHPKAGWLASVDAQGTLVLRTLDKGLELGRWKLEGVPPPAGLEFAPKRKALYVAAGKTVFVLDLETLE